MARHRGHQRRTLEEIEREIERRLQADDEADREYTTPERLAALRGEPDRGPPPSMEEDVRRLALQARAARGAQARGRQEAEPSATAAVEAELEQRIREEIADFEREAGCAPRGTGPGGEARGVTGRAGAGDRGRAAPLPGGRAGPASTGERAASVAPGEEGAASRGAAGREPRPASRVDDPTAARDAVAAMSRLEALVRRSGLEPSLLELVRLRASQIDGCASCVDVLPEDARARGQSEQRPSLTPSWREAPCYSARERAALEWTEALTLLPTAGAPDDVYERVRASFSEQELVALTLAIVAIHGSHRLAAGLRLPVGPHGRVTTVGRLRAAAGAARHWLEGPPSSRLPESTSSMGQTTMRTADLVLLAGTRVALGIGVGLLVATRLDDRERKSAGFALFAVGVLTTVPIFLNVRASSRGAPGGQMAPTVPGPSTERRGAGGPRDAPMPP